MKKVSSRFLSTFLAIMMLLSLVDVVEPTVVQAEGSGQNYYIDSVDGDDSNDGLSEALPWRSLEKVNSITFEPGDNILFKRGGSWFGQLWPKGSGIAGNPITISAYGTGPKPIIDGNGSSGYGSSPSEERPGVVVYLLDQSYWHISNLEITNDAEEEGYRYGVMIQAEAEGGTIGGIHISDLYIHEIRGPETIPYGPNVNKTGGIIVKQNVGPSTVIDGVIIENNIIEQVGYAGIRIDGTKENKSKNVVIRNNSLDTIGGSGIVPVACEAPLVEYNVVKQSANTASNAGLWNWGTVDAVFQYNEAYLTQFQAWDGEGFDCDGDSLGTVMQYNYSHDNEGGFMLVCSDATPNEGSIIRYNISQNDAKHLFRFYSRSTKNTWIYNNTFFVGAGMATDILDFSSSANGAADSTYFYNNIVYNLGRGGYKYGNGTNINIDYNCYYGNHPVTEPNDPHKIAANPRLIAPGSGGIGRASVDGYKLRADSPCINAGMTIPNSGEKDYWDNPVPYNGGVTDIGAHEFQGEPLPNTIDDNFNDEVTGSAPSGWTVTANGGSITVEEVPSASDKSVRLTTVSGTGKSDTMLKQTGELSGSGITIEARVRRDQMDRYFCLPFIYDSNGTIACSIVFNDGYIKASNGGALMNIIPFAPGEWYDIKVIMDTGTDKYDIYVNGALSGEQLNFRNPVSAISEIRFYADNWEYGTAYIDNVKVSKSIFIDDDFNDEPTGSAPSGWTVTANGGSITVEEVPSASDKSVRLTTVSGTGKSDTMSKQTGELSGSGITIEARVRRDQTDRYFCLPFIYDSNGTIACSIVFNDGYIKASNGGALMNIIPFAPGEWYDIKVIMDTNTDKYDIYVNGALFGEQLNFRNPVSTINEIRFYADNWEYGTAYIDNIKVHQ